MCCVLRIWGSSSSNSTTLSGWLREIASSHWSLKRNLGAARVEVWSSEVVVGVPGIGGQGKNNASANIWANDEEGKVSTNLVTKVDLHQHFVVARLPGGIDIERKRNRPTTAICRGILRHLVVTSLNAISGKHHFTLRTNACDFNANGTTAR